MRHEMKCPSCKQVDTPVAKWQQDRSGEKNWKIKLTCSGCGAYIKFGAHSEWGGYANKANQPCYSCGENTEPRLHGCPYSEISGGEELCNCCEPCQKGCAMEV